MKIAILTLGTRGDIQPYAVLGQALNQRGHSVIISTAKNYKQLVESYEVDFLPIEVDFQALLNSDEGKKMMRGNPFVIKRNLKTWLYPLIVHSLIEFYNLSRECDIILYHVKTLADSFADQFPEKMIRTNLLPIIEPTNEFANPIFSGLKIPKILNRMTYKFSNMSIKLLSKPIQIFRKKFNLSEDFLIPNVKNIYGISSHFLNKPHDYSKESSFTGFWFGTSKEILSKDVIEFLDKGEPPLLITFGSMPFKSKLDLQNIILKLVQEFHIRIIVIKGWGINETKQIDNHPNIKVIHTAPYEKLFPYVKAVIHHGGIGTTAECLRAGKPFMICPVLYPIGDQMFWGKLSYEKGIAVKPIPLYKMTEKIFFESINQLLSNSKLYDNIKKIQILINSEDGLKNAINEIEMYFKKNSKKL